MHAVASGILIAVGGDAWGDYLDKVEVGTHVTFAKYHGLVVYGKDGEEYRLLNDEDISSEIEEGVTFNDIQSRKKELKASGRAI